jgi:predicted MFS family arabinose efflux permease
MLSSFSSMQGLIETIFGFGLCVGPAVGAALYSVGGANAFTFPFVVLGGLLFISALITMCMLPNLKSKVEDEKVDDASHRGLWKLLQLPEVMLFAASMVAGTMGNSFLSATLEPHLRQVSCLLPIKQQSMD